MKTAFWSLILFVSVGISWAQQPEQHDLAYASVKLSKVLSDAETLFNIRYSYIDSIVAPKLITLPQKMYTLESLNSEITRQASLSIVKIDDRYYSVYQNEAISPEVMQEILIEGFLSKGIDKTAEKVILSSQKTETLPGVTDADILLSLQQLPGIKSPNETATGLHVRGGTSDQNLIMWDGIRLYHPGHLFGMISGFNPYVPQTVSYYNKGVNPKFGERISSVIAIETSGKIENQFKGEAGINGLSADAFLQAPLLKDKIGLQVSARKSYTELWQTPTFNALAKKVFQNTGFKDFHGDNRFGFEDYSARLNFRPFESTAISLTGIAIDNSLDFSSRPENAIAKNQQMNIRNYGYSLNWIQKYGPKLSHQILLHYSAYNFNYERKQYEAPGFETFTKLNRLTDSGAEFNFEYRPTQKLSFQSGYQLLGNDLSHSFTAGNGNFSIDLDQRHFFNVTHIGYLNAKLVTDKWDLQAGARYNYFNKLHTESFEPRALLQRKLGNYLVWQATYEKKSQILSQVRESVTNDLSLENYVWVMADNSQYPVQRADQATSGLIFKRKSWLLDADFYFKKIKGITSLDFGFLHQFDSQIRNGKGFTKGIDVLVQKSATDWNAWLTYTYQNSENKYKGLNNDDYFLTNTSINHALSLSLSRKWGNFSAAAGWFWHTGKPYSRLDSSGQILSFSSEKLPVYHRLDVSAIYHFHPKGTWSGKVGISVFNAYNRHSVISREYEREYSGISAILNSNYKIRDYYSLGLMPNAFVRIAF